MGHEYALPSNPDGSPDTHLATDSLHQFLRFSHIFSASVQEVVGTRYLSEVSPDSMTLAQLHILKLISFHGQHQVREVAESLGVSSPAVTKNIDKLERLGLITRSPSKGDRRATLLSASARGRALVDEYEELKVNRLTPVVDKFEPDELEKFSDYLQRFSVSLLKQERPERGFCLRCAVNIEDDCPIGHVRGGCPYQEPRGERPNKVDDQ